MRARIITTLLFAATVGVLGATASAQSATAPDLASAIAAAPEAEAAIAALERAGFVMLGTYPEVPGRPANVIPIANPTRVVVSAEADIAAARAALAGAGLGHVPVTQAPFRFDQAQRKVELTAGFSVPGIPDMYIGGASIAVFERDAATGYDFSRIRPRPEAEAFGDPAQWPAFKAAAEQRFNTGDGPDVEFVYGGRYGPVQQLRPSIAGLASTDARAKRAFACASPSHVYVTSRALRLRLARRYPELTVGLAPPNWRADRVARQLARATRVLRDAELTAQASRTEQANAKGCTRAVVTVSSPTTAAQRAAIAAARRQAARAGTWRLRIR